MNLKTKLRISLVTLLFLISTTAVFAEIPNGSWLIHNHESMDCDIAFSDSFLNSEHGEMFKEGRYISDKWRDYVYLKRDGEIRKVFNTTLAGELLEKENIRRIEYYDKYVIHTLKKGDVIFENRAYREKFYDDLIDENRIPTFSLESELKEKIERYKNNGIIGDFVIGMNAEKAKNIDRSYRIIVERSDYPQALDFYDKKEFEACDGEEIIFKRPISSNVGFEWNTQSPEQFEVKFDNDVFDLDENDFQNTFKIMVEDILDSTKNIELSMENNDFSVVELENNRVFLIELKKDWTEILDTQNTGEKYDINKKLILEAKHLSDEKDIVLQDSNQEEIIKKASNEIELERDFTYPYVQEYELLTKKLNEDEDLEILGKWYGCLESRLDFQDAGVLLIKFNEPVQLLNNAEDIINTTPTDGQEGIITLSQEQKESGYDQLIADIKYVKIKDEMGNDITNGDIIKGKLTKIPVNNQGYNDLYTIVEPCERLQRGGWKVVIKNIQDDIGNNISPEIIEIDISEKEMGTVEVKKIDVFYDETEVKNKTKDYRDIIHIKFDQNMDFFSGHSATIDKNYILNGTKLSDIESVWLESGYDDLKIEKDGSDEDSMVTISVPNGILNPAGEENILEIVDIFNCESDAKLSSTFSIPYCQN